MKNRECEYRIYPNIFAFFFYISRANLKHARQTSCSGVWHLNSTLKSQ